MKSTSLWQCLFLVAVTGICGCHSEYPETVAVTGTITLDGHPVPSALVTFMPTDGRRSGSGQTDVSGRFTLTTYAKGDGAVPGSHQVAVYPLDPPPMSGDTSGPTGSAAVDPRTYLPPYPEKYGLPKESGFVAEVTPDGENDFSFDMKSE